MSHILISPVLSKPERMAFQALWDAAEAGRPCPTNIDLEVMIGYASSSMGSSVVRRLEAKGMIRVRRYQRFREIQIVATGRWTARAVSQHSVNPHVPRGCGAGSQPSPPAELKLYRRS